MGFDAFHLFYKLIVKSFLIVLLSNGSLKHRRNKHAQGLVFLDCQWKVGLNFLPDDLGKLTLDLGEGLFKFVMLRTFHLKSIEVRFPENILWSAALFLLAILRKNPNIRFLPLGRIGIQEFPKIKLRDVMLLLRGRHRNSDRITA